MFQEFFQQYLFMYHPFENRLNQDPSKHGIHRAQWPILYYLVHEGPATATLVELTHYLRSKNRRGRVQTAIWKNWAMSITSLAKTAGKNACS